MSVVAASIFSLRSSVVRRRVCYGSAEKQIKPREVRRPWWLFLGPLCIICRPERTFRRVSQLLSENEAVLHPANSITGVLLHPQAVPKHHSEPGDVVWHLLCLAVVLVPRECFSVSPPHGFSWGSFLMGINCNTRNALRSAWQRALSPNMVSSARVLCGLNHSQHCTRRSIRSPCNSCTKCISYK